MCWARWARAALPLAPARYATVRAETTKNSQKKPNQPPVSAMHPSFLYIDCVI